MPALLDETALRLPGFATDTSAPVVLADGQTWYLPKPFVDYFPSFVDGKAVLNTGTTFGPEFDAKVAAFEEDDGFRDDKFFPALFNLTADLLRRNYSLADDDLSGLLRYRKDDPASIAWMQAVLAVANGNKAPKPSGGGDD